MAFFIQPTSSGGTSASKQFIPGNYVSAPEATVDSTAGGKVIVASSALKVRYLCLRVLDANTFIAFGTDPTTTNYTLKLEPGMQLIDLPINGQEWKAITATGTATIQTWIADGVATTIE